MDHTGAAPEQRLVFGGQLPFGPKPVRAEQPAKAQPEDPPSSDVPVAEDSQPAPEAQDVPETQDVPALAPRPEPAVWDVARPAHLPPRPAADQSGSESAGIESAGVEPTEPDDEPVPDYPDPPRTGDHAVDDVLDALARAVGGPLEEQLAVFDAAHRTLQDRLADVEG